MKFIYKKNTKDLCIWIMLHLGFPGGSYGKELPTMWETQIRSLGQEDPLEK